MNGLINRKMLLVATLAISCWLDLPAILSSGQRAGSCLAAEQPMVHDTPLEESVDFFQYTDEDGVIHFNDTPEKIPRRFRSKVIVRKDLPSARQVTRVAVVDSQIHLPVTLTSGGKSVQAVLLLDTGASLTCITEALAARLHIGPESSRASTTRLADGSEIAIRLAKIDSVSVGSKVKAPLEIGIMQQVGSPQLHDGLLGLDFLAEFQYQLDLPNGLIRWQ
jgi:hypothetical protein